MKDYITCSIDINGMRGKIQFNKVLLIKEFKAYQFHLNNEDQSYWLDIRTFIRWKFIEDVYHGAPFKKLSKLRSWKN
jgi:hypothetical protein